MSLRLDIVTMFLYLFNTLYFKDFVSPVTAAQTLLHSACKKRKEMLQKTMSLLLEILQATETSPSQKDGALHMIGKHSFAFTLFMWPFAYELMYF